MPVLATTPDRAETSTWVRPMHDLTRLEVLQLLLCNFRTGTRLRLDSFVPRESTVRVGPRDDVLQQDKTRCRHASEPGYSSSLVLLLYSSNDGWFSCSTAIATAEVVTAASGSVVITICCVLGPSPSPRGRDSQLWIVAPVWLLSSCRLPVFGLGFGQSVINEGTFSSTSRHCGLHSHSF